MNSAHVYKRHSFVSKDECVRIPDANIEQLEILSRAASKNEDAIPDRAINPETGAEAVNTGLDESTEQNDFEPSGEAAEPSGQKRQEDDRQSEALPDKETLSVIFKKEIEEISRAAAEAAAQAAYFDALNKKKSELRECVANVQLLLDELLAKHEEFIEQYTNELKYMAVDIAEKMILEKISADDTILQKLVLQNIKAVKNADWIGVELSERLVGLVGLVKKEIETPDYKGRVSVVPVAGRDDICRIITDDGALVSSISVQADNLRRAFAEAENQQA